jgi:tryptophan synthase alpha subunit
VASGRFCKAAKKQVWDFAEAAVIGSAIVREIEKLDTSPDLVNRVGEFARSLPGGVSSKCQMFRFGPFIPL